MSRAIVCVNEHVWRVHVLSWVGFFCGGLLLISVLVFRHLPSSCARPSSSKAWNCRTANDISLFCIMASLETGLTAAGALIEECVRVGGGATEHARGHPSNIFQFLHPRLPKVFNVGCKFNWTVNYSLLRLPFAFVLHFQPLHTKTVDGRSSNGPANIRERNGEIISKEMNYRHVCASFGECEGFPEPRLLFNPLYSYTDAMLEDAKSFYSPSSQN